MFNAIDSVSLAACSLFSFEEEAIIESDDDSGIKVEEVTQKELLKYIVSRENTSTRMTVVFNGIVSVIYIIFCLVLSIVATVDLVRELLVSEKVNGKNAADKWLCAVISMLPVVIFCFLQMCHFGVIYVGSRVGAAWGAVLSLMLAVGSLAFLVLKKNILSWQMLMRKLNRQTIKNMVCAALLITVMISVFMPCIKIDIGPHADSGNEETLYLSLPNLYETTSEDIAYYKTVSRDKYYNMISSLLEHPDDSLYDGKSVSEAFFYIFAFVCCNWDFRVFWGLIFVVTLMTLIVTGILLCNVLTDLLFDKSLIKRAGWLKILNLICIGVNLFLLIFIVCMDNIYLTSKLRPIISFRLGFAMAWMLIAMIIYIVLSFNKKKKESVINMDTDYDNADVSYAPYVW
jgi:hypothetical protein